jgi:hypothetical protein
MKSHCLPESTDPSNKECEVTISLTDPRKDNYNLCFNLCGSKCKLVLSLEKYDISNKFQVSAGIAGFAGIDLKFMNTYE